LLLERSKWNFTYRYKEDIVILNTEYLLPIVINW
jgi:hypothetical protein